MYYYYHRKNGKITDCRGDNFVEAHNCSYWAGAREFFDEDTSTPIPVLPQIITSMKQYTEYDKD